MPDTVTGRVMTVPKKGKDYDWTGLTECVARVKQQYASEHSVTVSADPQVQYEYVVAAMDAVRNRGKDPLFPDVIISLGVR